MRGGCGQGELPDAAEASLFPLASVESKMGSRTWEIGGSAQRGGLGEAMTVRRACGHRY